jgi:hypothetical protein
MLADAGDDRIDKPGSAVSHGIVSRETGLVLGGSNRCLGRVGVEMRGVERDAHDARRAPRERDLLVQADQLGE